ncbi:D-tyrosyl-tRNA(Tyr) deacylase [Candidatus Woesearchaeota archaeon]|nr:D-tyrosyl-tRNA(Tyr) deacylase [Candidatus Woesearchaeota archaeon]
MRIAIVVSKQDISGMNIKDSLLELFDFKKINGIFNDNSVYETIVNGGIIRLYTLNENTIYANGLDNEIAAELFVFATRHSAKSGIKTLCIHTPGNWDKAEFGGFDKKLCIAAPSLIKDAFLILNALAKDSGYECTLEATHHGPFIEKPCFFIEIGSSENEWKDKNAAEIIAKTIIQVFEREKKGYKAAFGIGGIHYCLNFNKIILRTDIAIGHICPKYALEKLNQEMILQAIEKTQEKVDFVLLDWKGVGKEKQRILELLKKLNLKYHRNQRFLGCQKSQAISKHKRTDQIN